MCKILMGLAMYVRGSYCGGTMIPLACPNLKASSGHEFDMHKTRQAKTETKPTTVLNRNREDVRD